MFKTLFALALPLVFVAPLRAQTLKMPEKPLLHPLFSENAVLQRDRPLTLWGWAQPGERVVIKFDDTPQTVTAADDGRWSAPLAAHPAGGPHTLEVAGAHPGQYLKRANLLFGDVWLCSGQSNMEWPVNAANDAAAEKAAANFPQIRLMRVPRLIDIAPLEFAPGASWQVCSPQSVGGFSAVGYFFGRKLNQDLNVPMGLIDSSWGGTPAEAWVSEGALQPMGSFNGAIATMHDSARNPASLEQKRAVWWNGDPGTQANWQHPELDDANWKTIAVPGAWEARGFADFRWRDVVSPRSRVARELGRRRLGLELGRD